MPACQVVDLPTSTSIAAASPASVRLRAGEHRLHLGGDAVDCRIRIAALASGVRGLVESIVVLIFEGCEARGGA